MADNPTPNYGLHRVGDPTTDLMSDFETWLNANWDKIKGATAPDSGTTLPQAGSYNVGDRFYKSDTKSIYILVCKDANWGWHWRPIHDAISPWLTVPATCLNLGTWTLNPTPSNPFQIAFDNRGKVYWRGIIGITAGTIPRNVSHAVFKPVPGGLKPRQRGVYLLGHANLSVGVDGTNFACYQGARIFIPDDGVANASIRCYGGTAEFNVVHLGGHVHYSAGVGKFFTV